ncbi:MULTISPECIES: UDP-N-acetylglucosamine 2-epimerase [Halomicrobium]|uniref:UDP-N-acetylglucosamine 2-epimerase n=1 Tax=Halomicrobium mukohataei (strain ATCC 700874 / DSM 12286 / JCM 9738 / NCIMB 13541) TaxID=485914 RepID=C7P3A8_HALMD|nr:MULTISPECIES: UDP-N-acetylglucosamine 2-epimerase [Halomicrobium]ACV47580.1 UDP-N-acetylglucosamine 2-epimerase [Halomicrobium mukohataei DSM 12286]
MPRDILAITGIRSEYDILYPALDAIQAHEELSAGVVASGGHVADTHGDTISYIQQNGFEVVDSVAYLLRGDDKRMRAKGVGTLVASLTEVVSRESPDILLVAGDREEPLATAIVGNYLDIPVAHIFGGDPVWGNADDPVRHAVSKMTHIHLTACADHRDRLVQMGEHEFRTFDVGNPGLDRIRTVPELSREELSREIGFDITEGPFLVLIKHPLSSERTAAGSQMETTMKALADLSIPTVAIHPNTDPGSEEIIDVLHEYQNYDFVSVHENFERDLFVNLLRYATALVGNSSAGILEAPFLSLPAVNIGNRQTGRTNAGNVVYVDHDVDEIVEAVQRLTDDTRRADLLEQTDTTYYGDGNSGPRIADVLANIDLDTELLVKSNRY